MFVTKYNSDSVSVISDKTNTVVATVPIGKIPFGITYDYEKGQIFVTVHNSDTVSVVSYSSPLSAPEFGPLTGFIAAISLTGIIIISKSRLIWKI